MTVRELDDLLLPDGRRLALCEVGDAYGVVAFYFHGTGSSRLETALYANAAAAHGVRLVGWDRPGSGGSPAQPGRTLLDRGAGASEPDRYLKLFARGGHVRAQDDQLIFVAEDPGDAEIEYYELAGHDESDVERVRLVLAVDAP